jgi:hypothetical protein
MNAMKFYIPDHTGHSVMEFSSDQRAEADALFAKLLAEGKTPATRRAGAHDYQVIRDPGQLQDETLFAPRYVGG